MADPAAMHLLHELLLQVGTSLTSYCCSDGGGDGGRYGNGELQEKTLGLEPPIKTKINK